MGALLAATTGLTVVASGGTASALPSNCTGTVTITCTFTYNGTDGTDGSAQTWTVPAGVTSAAFDVKGAEGGGDGQDTNFPGGLGGQTQGTVALTSGSTVTVTVGGRGALAASGGFNGGGGRTDSFASFGGGGASDVRVGGTTLADRVLVAGGGGGVGDACVNSSCAAGGPGGGTSGGDGTSTPTTAPEASGKGGTQSAGGAGGSAELSGSDGALGVGGNSNGNGGGGGGGYYGGGGGGHTLELSGPRGSGGGGSSFFNTPLVTGGSTTAGVRSGNGVVTVTYAAPATSTTVTSLQNPSTFGQPVTFTATVSPTDGSGTVGFFADGSATAISGCDAASLALVSGSYQATCSPGASLSAGNHPIHAEYTPGPGYLSSSGDLAGGQQINKATQAITFPALRSRSIVESPFTLTGASGGGSGNPVTFTASAGHCTVSGKQVTLTHTGSCTITAHQAGNGNYLAAPNRSRTFQVSVKPSLNIHDANTTEGNTGSKAMLVRVTMNKPVSVPVTVAWTTANGSATAPSDYLSAHGTLTFAPGQTQRTITTTVKGDKTKEPSEVFFVLISQPHNAIIADTNGSAGIINDD